MFDAGYRAPRKALFPVAGRNGIATIKGQLVNMRDGGFISAHDFHIASLIADVVCGGDVDAGSLVTEEYLMALERKHFCALLDHPKTQERIMGMLQTGKPVRNCHPSAWRPPPPQDASGPASRIRSHPQRFEQDMSKQVQDAYIVAATRTPIGKSGRGLFRNTRPDDLLVAAIQGALEQVPTLDPKAIEDAIIGCSFPEGEQGLNMARVAAAAGRPAAHGGRRHRQPLLRLGPDRGADGGRPHPRRRGRRDDRRRRREHEHGADERQQAVVQRPTSSTATRTSASPTAWA